MRSEILAALDELIDVNENYTLRTDDRTRALRERFTRQPVYVEVDSSRWCARHWSVILNLDDAHCSAYGMSEDDGHCVPVPLYIEAPDP